MWTRGHRTWLSLWAQIVHCPFVCMIIGVYQSQWVWMFPIPGCVISVWNTWQQFGNNAVCRTLNEYNVYHHIFFPRCLLSSAAYTISIYIHLKPVKYASSWRRYLIMPVVWQEGKLSLKFKFTTLVLLEMIQIFLRSGKKRTIRVLLGSAEILNQCVFLFFFNLD